ncbi:MAG: cysteine-rich small domain-containing protein [Paludibacteraceae bacterium]|nr:cysteine-rich small domain-containing protein [Paludibacteraceae bacterium]
MDAKYKFFSHKDCEFYPCHKISEDEELNCLFCYCPLYALGDKCGGNYVYLENGIKDCSNCKLPHIKDKGYDYVMKKWENVQELIKK